MLPKQDSEPDIYLSYANKLSNSQDNQVLEAMSVIRTRNRARVIGRNAPTYTPKLLHNFLLLHKKQRMLPNRNFRS